MAHLPTLNRVPDPASRSTQPAVEVWGTFMPVDLRRRSSRNWTSPNVLPTSTPRGCTSFFLISFKMSDHLTTEFYCYHLSRHSSGRGGAANLSSGKVPYPEGAGNPHGANHPHRSHEHDAESHGRGGRGNISRDHSREPGIRNTHNAPSGLAQSVTASG